MTQEKAANMIEDLAKNGYTMLDLAQLIRCLGKIQQGEAEEGIDEKIANLLNEIGIPQHLKGYTYITLALKIAYEDSDIMNYITKNLYPTIAKELGTTSSRVERAIRHAIEVSWITIKPNVIEKYFGNSAELFEKPKNSHFLATLSNYLRT